MSEAHHAYVSYAATITCLPPELQEVGPDVQHILSDRLSIKDSRQAITAAQQRPVATPYMSIVLQFAHATLEAQNALLKLLEEPPTTAKLYIVVPGPERLIETVRSRLAILETAPKAPDDSWQQFVALALSEQLLEIAKRSKDQDIGWQRAVLEAAVQNTAVPQATRAIIDQYMHSPGASRKWLLEELAIALAQQ